MASNSETGHVKNAANFGLLISAATAMGTDYNPSNITILLTALITKQTDVEKAMKKVTTDTIPYKNAVNGRDDAYQGMSALSTRMLGSLKGSGAGDDIIKDAKGIKNKIEGKRTGKKPPKNVAQDGSESEGNSVSQMSFDNRRANFELFVELLKGEPKYIPNEDDLKTTALDAYLDTLQPLNKKVDDTKKDLEKTKDLRDVQLYEDKTGVFSLQKAVKEYVKSLPGGASSTTYKNIAKIKFTDKKKK